MTSDFEHFFKMNERRIHYQIHRLGINSDWYEDFFSEGLLALWQAYKEYDGRKGVEIGTFINYKIRYRLLDFLRKKLRDQEVVAEAVEEKKVEMGEGNRHRATRIPVIGVDQDCLWEDDRAFWQEVRRHLSERQWKWVQYFIIADLSIKEIMEIEDVSADAVKSWGKAVRAKLRKEKVRQKLLKLM